MFPVTGRRRSTCALLGALAAVGLMAGACSGAQQAAGPVPTTAEPGPGGTTPSNAGPADGVSTTTAALAGPASTAPDAVVLGATEAPQRCRAGAVVVTVEDESSEAGHQHRRIVLTNTGPEPCTVSGYPGVLLRDASGRQLGVPAAREPLDAATVTLASGASASASLDQQSPGVFPAEACGVPVAVVSVQVIIPDETEPVVVPTQGEACPNPVDQLSVRPLQAGRDSQP
jgi:hypothetical protein